MVDEELEKMVDASEGMAAILSNFEQLACEWADRKEKLYKIFTKELDRYRELIEDMPDEWFIGCSNQFAAGKIFGSPTRIKKFLNQHRDTLYREEKQVLLHFMENPWFYSLFSVEESFGKNLFHIYDHAQHRSLMLLSKGVQKLHRYGSNLFLCLLFDTGECYQTYGTIHYYHGFNARDIECFSRFTGRRYEQEVDLAQSIYDNPVPFMVLYRFSGIPAIYSKGEPQDYCYHSAAVENFDPGEYSKVFTIREKEGIIKCIPKKGEGPDFIAAYYEKTKRILHIAAIGMKQYKSLVKLFKGRCDFPGEPSWRVSANMNSAMDIVLGVKHPTYRFEELFSEEPNPEEARQIARLNAMMGEMMDNFSRGVEYSAEKLAERHGIPLDTVLQLQEEFGKKIKEFDIDIVGGFDDYTPPPPAERMKFHEPFPDNSLFEFHNSAKADMYFKIKLPDLAIDMEVHDYETLTLHEYQAFIEDLFFEYWDVQDCAILLYTLYLLSKKGDTFQPVRHYAVEFLRIFWQTVLPSKSQKQIDEFIADYSVFCFDVLEAVGLIDFDRELDEESAGNSDFQVKATPFFYEWIRFIQSH